MSIRGFLFSAVFLGAALTTVLAQDLTPTTFLQRDLVNDAMIDGTGGPRVGSARDVAERDPAELPSDPEAPPSSEAADAFESIALALVPRALRFRLGLEFRAEYDSNITVGNSERDGGNSQFTGFQQSEATADFILQTTVNFGMTWHFAGGNALGIDLDIGYRHYFQNPEFSSPVLNTGTPGGLALRFATGEVVWTLFDLFSFTTNPGSEAELSGVGEYRSFTNTFGLGARWSVSDQIGLRAGLDRTYVSTTSDESELERTSDSLNLALVYGITPLMETGLSGSLTFSREDNSFASDTGSTSSNESTAISLGPFFRGQITAATTVFLTGGVQVVKFDDSDENDSSSGSSSDSSSESSSEDPSFYGSLRITNQLTHFYSHSFFIGRGTSLGLVSDSLSTDSARYEGVLRVGQRTSLNGSLFIEKSAQSGGPVGEKFVRYGGQLAVDVALRPTISASLGWEHSTKDSDQEGFDYKRDVVFLSVSWIF